MRLSTYIGIYRNRPGYETEHGIHVSWLSAILRRPSTMLSHAQNAVSWVWDGPCAHLGTLILTCT